MGMKPYRDNTPLEEILRDGWSRGFLPEQTIEEASAMGFKVSEEDVDIAWHNFQTEMEAYFANDPYHENDDGWIET
jgi:hypothetical protein